MEPSKSCEGDGAASWQRLAQVLHHRTEGNPLFLVAMVEDFITRGVIVHGDRGWVIKDSAATIEDKIPDSIRQLMTLQSDRLSPDAQQTLEAASIAGMEFSAVSVAAALATETVAIERHCEQLAKHQHFLRRVGVEEWPDGTLAARYSFLHAVYQQLWHERVSPTQLQHSHLRIGERKEHAYGERVREIAAELAIHFEQGREYAKAVQYYGQAAQTAFQRHALHEVMAHAVTGLSLLQRLPETSERHQQELPLQMMLGATLMTTKGFAAPEVGRVYARALALCRQLGESPQLFPVLFGLALFYAMQGQLNTALEIETQLQHLAQRHPDPLHCTEVHFVSGLLSLTQGEFASAQASLEHSLALYEPQRVSTHIVLYGQDPGVAAGVLSAFACWLRGYPEQAVRQTQAVLTLARESAHPYSLGLALFHTAQVYQLSGKVQTVQAHTRELIPFAQAQGIANGIAYGTVLDGWVLSEQGQIEEGLVRIHEGLAKVQALEIETGKSNCFAWLTEAYSKVGQVEKGLKILAEALATVQRTEERWYEAELYRLKGELTLQQFKVQGSKFKVKNPQSTFHLPPPSGGNAQLEAEECFRKAIEIARKQQAKSWELRASTSLAHLWRQQDRKKQAHKMLSEIYDWFTEGFDTKDLQEAKALLDALAK